QIGSFQQVVKCISTHFCNKLVWVSLIQILVFFWKGFKNINVFFFRKEIHTIKLLTFNIYCRTRIYYHIAFVINNLIQFLSRQTKKVSDFIWKRLKVPDMCYRNYEADMPHTLSSHFLFGNFYPTSVTHNSFVANTLILSAVTFKILYRTEYTLTKK